MNIDPEDIELLSRIDVPDPVERDYVPVVPVGARWEAPHTLTMYLSDGSTQVWDGDLESWTHIAHNIAYELLSDIAQCRLNKDITLANFSKNLLTT